MNAKDKQKEFISNYLKAALKENGYRTSGNTWWRESRDFFFVINLQNSQWNSRNRLSFCLNIGPALTSTLSDPKKRKASYFDITVHHREDSFLSEARRKQPFHQGWLGYLITDSTELDRFTKEFSVDLENEILPNLHRLESLEDWMNFVKDVPFWHEHLTRMIKEFPSL
ncbi:MAG: DUF4304 domain-containing protein [Chloracidobacterium sp.]|nr:DUF4304 domain-containing protein [Chloracidobacterium sp.]